MNPESETFWSTIIFPIDRPFMPTDTLDAIAVHDSLGLLYRADLQQAQRDFIASQLDETRAMVAYLNALIDLYVSEGTLLERRGVHAFDN